MVILPWFPVDFPLNQSIVFSNSSACWGSISGSGSAQAWLNRAVSRGYGADAAVTCCSRQCADQNPWWLMGIAGDTLW